MECSDKYIILIPVKEGTIVFNILTRGMHLIKRKNIKNINTVNNEIKNELKKRFVCLDESDEQSLLKYVFNKFRYTNENKIIITDAYTFDCNLACVYCLQQNISKNKMILKPEERVEIWNTLKNIFHVNYLDIVLFGGEPFYNTQYLDKLLNIATQKINDIRNIGAVTNGAFSVNAIDIIKKYKLKYIQITIDGPKEIHDKRRIFKGSGKGTWDIIHKNILKVLKNTGTIIVIHTVIDGQNWERYGEMLDFMINKYKKWIYAEEPRIIFNLGMESHPYGFARHTKKYILNYKKYSEIYLHAVKEAAIRELTVIDFMGSMMCSLNKNNEMIVGPDGAVYKCVSAIGIPAFKVADKEIIMNEPEKFIVRYAKFIEGLKPKSECLSCKYFPVCGGGCYYNAYIENKSLDCWMDAHKQMLPELAKVLYNAEEINFDILKLHGMLK